MCRAMVHRVLTHKLKVENDAAEIGNDTTVDIPIYHWKVLVTLLGCKDLMESCMMIAKWTCKTLIDTSLNQYHGWDP